MSVSAPDQVARAESARALIVIPTYNEAENLENLVHAIFGQGDFRVLVVDDGSPDGTGDIAESLKARYPDRVDVIHRTGKLPVPNFSAGGIATPADASLMMQLGAEAVFVGSGIFKSEDPAQRAKAIVDATTHFDKPDVIAELSKGLGKAMEGLDIRQIEEKDLLSTRGW